MGPISICGHIFYCLWGLSTTVKAQNAIWYKAIYRQTYFPKNHDIDTAAYLSDLRKFLPDSIGEKGYLSKANMAQIIYNDEDTAKNSKKAKDYKKFVEQYAPLTLSSIYAVFYVSPRYNYYAKAYFTQPEKTIAADNASRLHGPVVNRSQFGTSQNKDLSLTDYKSMIMAFHFQVLGNGCKASGACVSLPDSSAYVVKKLSEKQQVGSYSCTLYLVKNKKGKEMKIWVSNRLPWYVNNGMFIPQLHHGFVAVQTEVKGKPVAYTLVSLEKLSKHRLLSLRLNVLIGIMKSKEGFVLCKIQ